MISNPALSPKRQRFVEEYLIDFNGTQAAIRAGYSKGAANVTASRLLRDANVQAALAAGRGRLTEKLELTAERVISELCQLAFARISDFFSVDAAGRLTVNSDALADPRRCGAITHLDIQTASDGSQAIKFRLGDKKAALIELARHLDLFAPETPATPPEEEEVDPRRLAMALMDVFRQIDLREREETESTGARQLSAPSPDRY